MNRQDQIVSLLQTLGTSFRHFPNSVSEKLGILTEEELEKLLELLKRVSAGNKREYSFGHFPEDREPRKPNALVYLDRGPTPDGPRKNVRLPEPDTYDEITDRSAICRGCPSGCELRWDDHGNFGGYSCIVGQETAEMLAEYYRAE